MPGGPANLALGDLALNAAIELERFQVSPDTAIDALTKLSEALTERSLTDLALVPVYDRALASSGAAGPESRSDLHSRLRRIAAQMQSSESASKKDLELLRDFCVALHDALLTTRLQSPRQPVGQRRLL